MKITNTATRLKEIMSIYNLRQVDILNKCLPYCKEHNVRLGRNDISQYVSGKVEPGQDKLSILGHALNVNEAWLMGYDVPKERTPKESLHRLSLDAFYSSEDGHKLISSYLSLNEQGKKNLLDHCDLLLSSEKYRVELSPSVGQLYLFEGKYTEPYKKSEVLNAAHERTDIKVTEKMRKHDDDIMDDILPERNNQTKKEGGSD